MTVRIDKGRLFQMPAKEWHIQSDVKLSGPQTAYVQGGTPDDMIAMAIWADAVHRDGGEPSLIIPYLPGARQDRRAPGEALSCKVYADMINACDFDRVVCLDPHSDVMPALLDRCVIASLECFLANLQPNALRMEEYIGFIIPDAGAIKRVEKVARFFGKPTFQASKHRDMATGKLSGFSVSALPTGGRLLIVDDICDGGGTFMGLADVIREAGFKGDLDLWVTHGIFSGDNAENLHKYFERILTTDSYDRRAYAAGYNHAFLKKLMVFPAEPALREYR